MSRRKIWLTLLLIAASVGGGYWLYQFVAEQQRLAALAEELRAEEELQRPLQKIVTLKFGGPVPLRDWLAELSRQMEVEVILLPDATDPFGGPSDGAPTEDMTIALDLPPLPAEEALEAARHQLKVDWRLRRDGVVEFNCPKVEFDRVLQRYPLDLELIPGSSDEIVELITMTFDPDQWADVGGPWWLEQNLSELVVLMPSRDHRRLNVFLQQLMKACRQTRSQPTTGGPLAVEPIWLDGDTDQLLHLQRVLDEPLNLPSDEKSLPGWMKWCAKQVDFPILIDSSVAAELDPAIVIKSRPQQTSLRLILRDLDLDEYDWQPFAGHRVLMLVERDVGAYDRCQTRLAYPIADLTADKDSAGELIELITTTIEQDSWSDVGGPGCIQSFDQDRLLIVSQQLAVQQRVQELLTALRKVKRGLKRQVALTPDPRICIPTAEIEERMNTPLSFDYVGTKQKDAFEDVFYRGDIHVSALEGGLWHAQGPIWIHLPTRPLRENLATLLSACHYDVNYLDHITSRGRPPEEYVDQSTLVSGVVFNRRPWLRERPGWPDLEDLLVEGIQPDHWWDVGGPGRISDFQDLLVVHANPRVMNRARNLLAALEQHLQPGPRYWQGELLAGERLNHPLDLHSRLQADALREHVYAQRNEEIRQKLQQPISIKIEAQHVGKTMLQLAREHEVPMVVTLLEAWPNEEQIAAVDVENKPLGEVLQQLIGDSQQITWQVRNGCLSLTDPNLRVDAVDIPPYLYTVDDLIAPRGPFLPKQFERTLEQAIKLQNPGKSLDDLPGPGIKFQFGNLLLVRYQDPEEPSRKVFEQLLRDLRSGKLKPVPAEKGDADYSAPPGFGPFLGGSPIPIVGQSPSTTRPR